MQHIKDLARSSGMIVYEGEQDRVLFERPVIEALKEFRKQVLLEAAEAVANSTNVMAADDVAVLKRMAEESE